MRDSAPPPDYLRRPLGVEAILDEMATITFRDMKDAQAFLDRRTRAYNAAPQLKLGELSPDQMRPLLYGDWHTGEGLRITTDLTCDEVAGSDFLFNTRVVLGALRDDGPAAATATGNFSRGFVAKMVDRMRLAGDPPRYFLDRRNVLNEKDIWPLHIVRLVLSLSGLIARRKGFRISKRGKLLLSDDHAGELYALLFRTYYRELNLGYTDGLGERPELQSSIAYSFWILGRLANDWVDCEELSGYVWLHRLGDPAPPSLPELPREARWRTMAWLIHPLIAFGLLEERDVPDNSLLGTRVEVRKASLFDRFLRFRFGDDAACDLTFGASPC